MAEEPGKGRRPSVGSLIAPGLLAVFCVWYASIILELPQGPGEEGPLGPSFAPWLWASLLAALVLIEIGASRFAAPEGRGGAFIKRRSLLDALTLVLLLVGFALAMQRVGFSAAAALFLAVSVRWSGIRDWKIILPYAVVFALAANYVFHHVLQVPLPQDWLPPR